MVKNRLLDIRLEMRYKRQKDFAEFLGIEQSQYSKYENNRSQPELEVTLRICLKLNRDIREIFKLVDE